MSSALAPDMVRHLKAVADPALASDGSRVVFTYSWVDEESLESRSRLRMLSLSEEVAETAMDFTQGERDAYPKFSPDGRTIAFLRPDDAGLRQVWLINADGGEARQLTRSRGNVIDLAWAPDSTHLVLCADVDPQAPELKDGGVALPEVRVARRIKYRYDGMGWRGDAHFHLSIVRIDSGQCDQITDGDWDDFLPVWSPDGSRIAFVSSRREDRDITSRSEAYVVSVPCTPTVDPVLWSEGLETVGALAWSPDGKRLVAAGSPANHGLGLWQSWLYTLEPGQPPKCLTDDSIRPCLGIPGISPTPEIRWLEDGRILFLGESRGESYLMETTDGGGETRRVVGGGMLAPMLSIAATGQRAALISNTPDSPADLQVLDVTAQTTTRLTGYNDGYLHDHPPARQEKFSINRQGLDIECRLYFPPDFDPTVQYPLVLEIHGGPNGSFYDSFVPLQQLLATNGYLVLAVNPRGSSTYGEQFMVEVLDDWGGEDYLDLMAAVDEVAARPYADETRMGVHGYSYGGFMSSWIVGHTQRFRAAVVGAPCTDLVSMYGTSDIGVSFGEVQWGGTMETAFQKLVDHSPITYASNVEAPVLLLHGESDARCPISQSEAYFVRLKRLGKEVEMVRFPGSSHSLPRQGHPRLREEYLARTLEWFNRYV